MTDMKQGDSAKAKRRVSDDQRREVLELRRRHSLREVAEATGLPLGTVKTLVSRSKVFRDNDQHRALFTLPPIKASEQTLPAVPELPPQQRVTGDDEIDAMLWLRAVINTGEAALIYKAMEAAEKIKTPRDVLEKRYRDYLAATNPGNLFAALSSFGFADLDSLSSKAIEQRRLRLEGAARFGDALLADTEADAFCIEALDGLEYGGPMLDYDKSELAARFNARPELLPHTLADCLHELGYWDQLYRLRNAVDIYASDGPAESTAREWFVFGLLADIRPRGRAEARAVFRYLIDSERDEQDGAEAIISNLIG